MSVIKWSLFHHLHSRSPARNSRSKNHTHSHRHGTVAQRKGPSPHPHWCARRPSETRAWAPGPTNPSPTRHLNNGSCRSEWTTQKVGLGCGEQSRRWKISLGNVDIQFRVASPGVGALKGVGNGLVTGGQFCFCFILFPVDTEDTGITSFTLTLDFVGFSQSCTLTSLN